MCYKCFHRSQRRKMRESDPNWQLASVLNPLAWSIFTVLVLLLEPRGLAPSWLSWISFLVWPFVWWYVKDSYDTTAYDKEGKRISLYDFD